MYFYSAINNCSHCAVVSSKPVSFQQAPEVPKTSFSSRRFDGRLFHTRVPAAAKLLSPDVLYVRGTLHDLSCRDRCVKKVLHKLTMAVTNEHQRCAFIWATFQLGDRRSGQNCGLVTRARFRNCHFCRSDEWRPRQMTVEKNLLKQMIKDSRGLGRPGQLTNKIWS